MGNEYCNTQLLYMYRKMKSIIVCMIIITSGNNNFMYVQQYLQIPVALDHTQINF